MHRSLKIPLKLVLPYLIISILWILFSDKYLSSLGLNDALESKIETGGDCLFVLVTSAFLFFQIKKYIRIIEQQHIAQLKQQSLYRAIIDNGNDIITLSNSDGVVLYISDNVTRYSGYAVAELINRSYGHIVHPDDYKTMLAAREMVNTRPDATCTFEMRLLHKDGTYVWVESNLVNKMHDPLLEAFIGNTRIITKRKENEKALRDSEELFRAIFEQAAVGLAFITLKGDLQKINHRMTEITGYSADEIFNYNFFKVTHPDDINNEEKLFQNLSTGNINQYSIIKRIISKDGSYIWVNKTSSLIRDISGKPQYVLNALHDITEKIVAEQELNYRNKELDTYIYRSSHDLRGPISTIMGLSMFAESDVDDEKAVSYFAGITRLAKSMDKLLGNLMAISQIRENKFEKVSVNPKIFSDEISAKFSAGDVTEFDIDLDFKSGYSINTDPELLRIILINLLENAFKFRLSDTKVHCVKLKFSCIEEKLQIIVSDTGIGMPPNEKEKMFDLYFRGKHAHQGSGVGLYVVKAAIDKLGGKIDVNTYPDKGTEVIVRIPECCSAKVTG